MKKGFLYIANRQKFMEEALISARSLKRYNSEPVCIICTSILHTQEIENVFDEVIVLDELAKHTYLSKVIGMQNSPFDQTIFLDSDTFVTDTISELFDILELVDFATTTESKLHTYRTAGLKYQRIFPEFNSGVIVYRNSTVMKKVIGDWLAYCIEGNVMVDMPGLREAVLMNFDTVRFSILPDCYNEHGFSTMLILNQKVKVIHERLGYDKGIITPHFLDFKAMDKFANKINKVHYKRLYVPKLGIISYRWSPVNLILFIKKKLGYKRVSKNS